MRAGPHYDELCVCGHQLRDHHLSWIATTAEMLAEECENGECEELGWEGQCRHFRAEQEEK